MRGKKLEEYQNKENRPKEERGIRTSGEKKKEKKKGMDKGREE